MNYSLDGTTRSIKITANEWFISNSIMQLFRDVQRWYHLVFAVDTTSRHSRTDA